MSMDEDIALVSSENSSILASIEVVDEETTDQFSGPFQPLLQVGKHLLGIRLQT